MEKKMGLLIGTTDKVPTPRPKRKVNQSPTKSLFAPVPTNGPYGTRDNREKLVLFLRGFRDGAGANAHQYTTELAYLKGYEEGSAARAAAVRTFCEEIEHDPFQNILRCNIENATENR
jgi:hypothetical protein